MRRELAPFGLEAQALHQPFELGLQFHQRLDRLDPDDDRARLASAKCRQSAEPHLEAAPLHAVEQQRDLVRQPIVDIADEAQRDVIILRVDPARSRQPAPQQCQRLADFAGDFQTDEQARHRQLQSRPDPNLSRNHDRIWAA